MNPKIETKIARGHMGKTIVFESDRDHELFMQDFLSPSYIEDKFNSWKVLENYDVKNIDFKQSLVGL